MSGEAILTMKMQRFLCQVMGTVPYYAIIDTGLVYSGINPATGWTGESCVLLVARH